MADRPNLIRISPERQMQDPEVTFGTESKEKVEVEVDREDLGTIRAGDELETVADRLPWMRLTPDAES